MSVVRSLYSRNFNVLRLYSLTYGICATEATWSKR